MGRIAILVAGLVFVVAGCGGEEGGTQQFEGARRGPEADRDAGGARRPEGQPTADAKASPEVTEPAAPRNVLLVTIDTLRADALGTYDPSRRTSPHIDHLAAEGAVFEQCVTSAPSTLPSHASILTGKQPYAHGARSNFGYLLAPGNVSLAEVLRDAEVAFTDDQIGRVVAALERLGLARRTLVVLTSDHGEGLGEHGEESHSFFVYDTTVRVPLILWGPPELPRGRRIDTLVRTVDIAPTVLDWLGLPGLKGIQGVSVLPLVTGGFFGGNLTGYGESIESFATFGTSVLRFVREGRWKYIHKVSPELYDLEKDPQELENRAPFETETVARLQERLRKLVADAPSTAAGAEVAVDAETAAQLNALGYAGSTVRARIGDELASLELSGPDPAGTVSDVSRYAEGIDRIEVGDRYESALGIFRDLHERYPESVPFLDGLIKALRGLGRDDEALPLLQRAVELDPRHSAMSVELAQLLLETGDLAGAEQIARAAVSLDPCGLNARVGLSEALASRKSHADQIAVLAEGAERCPESPELRNAYALATSPAATVRDGAQALQIAREITQGAGASHPHFVDTLAAAHAENGDFAQAVAASQRALELLDAQNRDVPDPVRAAFEKHLETLQAGQPIREN
jgi:tetratricopeptide (TPR) repeat protein